MAATAMTKKGSSSVADRIAQANDQAVEKMNKGRVMLVDFDLAKNVVPGMKDNLVLHAGPPIEYAKMIDPMKVAIQGALIFEGRAKSLDDADKLAASGELEFAPCHEHSTVAPMAGIVTPGMMMCVVENPTYGNRAFCNLHEGRGKILRFGGWDEQILERLHWMNDVLAPALKKVVSKSPVDLKVIVSKGLMMGDEFHERYDASSLLFLRAILDGLLDQPDGKEVIKFIAEREQYYLNLAMPAMKALADPADGIEHSTIVTRLTRNGIGYGIGISGMKGKWFVGPVVVPKGLYFPGFKETDAAGDFGDSAIMETMGLGGYASAASPAVTRFVGGTVKDAVQMTQDGYKVCHGVSRDWLIPALDFKGCPVGIDMVKVNRTGLVPKSNTGIAHKKPGIGQIGGGISHAPLSAFQDALRAFAAKYGL
jgi:hypothetical protein